MPNNPIPDAALAELDRLQHGTTPRPWLYGKVWLDHVPNYMAVIALHNAYPALRKRLTDAEARLAEVEREIEFLRSAGEAEVNFWVNVIRSLDMENLCDFFDGVGAKEELQRWLAARDAQQRREGAAEWLENKARTSKNDCMANEYRAEAARLRSEDAAKRREWGE